MKQQAPEWRTITVPGQLHCKLKERAKLEGRKLRVIVERFLMLGLKDTPRVK